MAHAEQQQTWRRIREAIEASWDEATSVDPVGWSPENPALGQCAVTALLVQDLRGGELLRCMVGDVSHYWNRLPSGEEVDLTQGQFPPGFSRDGTESRERSWVLSFPKTDARYRLLVRRFRSILRDPSVEG